MQAVVTHCDIHSRLHHMPVATYVINMQTHIWALVIENNSQSVRGVSKSSTVLYVEVIYIADE